MNQKKPTFASMAKPVQPRGILKDHAERNAEPQPAKAPAKRAAKGQGGKPKPDTKERANVQRSIYFTEAEINHIDSKRGLIKLAPHIRQALHDAGYFKDMKKGK